MDLHLAQAVVAKSPWRHGWIAQSDAQYDFQDRVPPLDMMLSKASVGSSMTMEHGRILHMHQDLMPRGVWNRPRDSERVWVTCWQQHLSGEKRQCGIWWMAETRYGWICPLEIFGAEPNARQFVEHFLEWFDMTPRYSNGCGKPNHICTPFIPRATKPLSQSPKKWV